MMPNSICSCSNGISALSGLTTRVLVAQLRRGRRRRGGGRGVKRRRRRRKERGKRSKIAERRKR